MSTPLPTARRNLAWRIEQFLRIQEAKPAPNLTGWQADTVLAAIEALDEERFGDGERTMMKAERPDLWEPATHVPVCHKDVSQLLAMLEKASAAIAGPA